MTNTYCDKVPQRWKICFLFFIKHSEYAEYTINFWAVFKFRQIVGMSENAGSIKEFDENWTRMKLQFTEQVQKIDELMQSNKKLALLYVNQARIGMI